jgi:putative oxidoreductase
MSTAITDPPKASFSGSIRLKIFAIRYAQIALGASFLCAVADRFGLLGKLGGWGNVANFTTYTAKVLSFMPASSISFFVWAATTLEIILGFGLIIAALLPSQVVKRNRWPQWIAMGSSVLLLLFAISMAISLAWTKPLDYSVFTASACALLSALFISENR